MEGNGTFSAHRTEIVASPDMVDFSTTIDEYWQKHLSTASANWERNNNPSDTPQCHVACAGLLSELRMLVGQGAFDITRSTMQNTDRSLHVLAEALTEHNPRRSELEIRTLLLGHASQLLDFRSRSGHPITFDEGREKCVGRFYKLQDEESDRPVGRNDLSIESADLAIANYNRAVARHSAVHDIQSGVATRVNRAVHLNV